MFSSAYEVPGRSGIEGIMPSPPSEGSEATVILADLFRPIRREMADSSAQALVAEFGSLPAVLGASATALSRILGAEPQLVECLASVRRVMLRALSDELTPETVLSGSETLHRYLYAAMAHEDHEQVRVLFLNPGNRLLRDEIISRGGAMASSLPVRHVIRRALELGATALIVVHNHPSGDHRPSRVDIGITRELVEGGRALEITVHDHIVISRNGFSSLRAMGLL